MISVATLQRAGVALVGGRRRGGLSLMSNVRYCTMIALTRTEVVRVAIITTVAAKARENIVKEGGC